MAIILSGLGFSPPAPSSQKKSSGFAGGRQFLCVPKTDFCQITENEQRIKIQFWWLEPHLQAAVQTTCLGETRLGGIAQVKTWHVCPLVVCSCKDTSFPPLGHYTVYFSSVQSLSGARLFATPWTAAYQGPPSIGFSRQEYWSGLPLPSPFSPSRLLKV